MQVKELGHLVLGPIDVVRRGPGNRRGPGPTHRDDRPIGTDRERHGKCERVQADLVDRPYLTVLRRPRDGRPFGRHVTTGHKPAARKSGDIHHLCLALDAQDWMRPRVARGDGFLVVGGSVNRRRTPPIDAELRRL